mgnify:FL=1
MTSRPKRRIPAQYSIGLPAVLIKGSSRQPISAVDTGGREMDLYVEKLDPKDTRQPRFFCPSCGDALLEDQGITGPNNQHTYRCPNCGVEWRRADNMPRGIGLAMA